MTSPPWPSLRAAIAQRQGQGLTTFGMDLPKEYWPVLHGSGESLKRQGIVYRTGLGYSVEGDRREMHPEGWYDRRGSGYSHGRPRSR